MALVQVGTRIEETAVGRIDAIAAAIKSPGALSASRSDALRAVIDAGIPVIEKELGIAPPAPAKEKKSAPRKAR